MDDMIY